MDLLDNPFYILGVTQRDDISKIVELAAERLLLSDAEACMKAETILKHPSKRVSAEVAWLPGVNCERIKEFVMLLETSAGNQRNQNGVQSTTPVDSIAAALSRLPYTETYNVGDEVLDLLKLSNRNLFFDSNTKSKRSSSERDTLIDIYEFLGIDKLNSIARSNLLAARMSRLPNHTSDYVADWILALAQAFEDRNNEDLCAIINMERKGAGFAEITDVSVIAIEIQNRRNYYQKVIKSVLNNIHSAKERLRAIMKLVDESSISHSKNRKPILIEDTIDAYSVKATPILENEEKNIKLFDRKLRYAADTKDNDRTLTDLTEKFTQSVKNWHVMAKPILEKKKRLGFKDNESYRIAKDVHQLAVYLFAEHDELSISQQILNALKEVFAESPTIVETIAHDIATLKRVAKRREQEN